MRHPDGRLLQGLLDEVVRLGRAQRGSDDRAKLTATWAVLAALYRCEQAEVKVDSGYFTDRDARREGRTLGGLIFLRGLVEHHQAETEQAWWQPVRTKIAKGGGWVDTVTRIRTADGWREVDTRVFRKGYPPRDGLPPGRRERHGRDVMYDEHVAGRALLEPIHDAVQFLQER